MSKYHKMQYLKRAIQYRGLDNPYHENDKEYKSIQWYYIYLNALDNINRSRDLYYIDMMKFLARYSLRQIQLLGQELHKPVVQNHYLHCKIENTTLKIVTNPNIIKKALQVKLDYPFEYRKQWSGYENIIGEELKKLGFDTNDPQVVLWGLTSSIGKWKLSNLVDEAYNKLSIWNSIPAKNATEQKLDLNTCGFELWYDKDKKGKTKKKADFVKFSMPIPS